MARIRAETYEVAVADPETVINEAVSGSTSTAGLAELPSILTRHPDAQRVLVMFGMNDARPWLPKPSGLGLWPGDTGWTNFTAGDYDDVRAIDDDDFYMAANATADNAVQCRFTIFEKMCAEGLTQPGGTQCNEHREDHHRQSRANPVDRRNNHRGFMPQGYWQQTTKEERSRDRTKG